MKDAIYYTHNFYEGQGTALGCLDQSLYTWKNEVHWANPAHLSKQTTLQYCTVYTGPAVRCWKWPP